MRRLFLCFLLISASPVWAQVKYQGQCSGQFRNTPVSGVLTIEYLPYSDTHAYRAVFQDPQRNRIDIEVITNQNGGVGGAWINHAKHRAARIEMRHNGPNFTIVDYDNGGQGAFTCR